MKPHWHHKSPSTAAAQRLKRACANCCGRLKASIDLVPRVAITSNARIHAKPIDAILAQRALQVTVKPQRVQMGNRLTHGKGGLVQVEHALEQHWQQLGGATGLGATGLQHFSQTVTVVVVQLLNALMQAGKRFAAVSYTHLT